jgi:beta-lactamase class A
MSQIRLNNYKYVKPLLLSDISSESSTFINLRSNIEQYIQGAKAKNQIQDISVYFRRLNDGSWFCINESASFNPASMSKIIFLITYLKEAESNPQLLNKKIFFEKHFSSVYTANIKDFVLKEKTTYTIKNLLSYMIKYSDNDATELIIQNLNRKIYLNLFTDLKIPTPPEFGEYEINTEDYSKFFRTLYNSTYISPDLSEFGLQLLTQSTFKDGLVKGIDPSLEISHKFGERVLENNAQLHEFGIVFAGNEPYLIGVMTKGKSLQELSTVISEISRLTFSGYHSYSSI